MTYDSLTIAACAAPFTFLFGCHTVGILPKLNLAISGAMLDVMACVHEFHMSHNEGRLLVVFGRLAPITGDAVLHSRGHAWGRMLAGPVEHARHSVAGGAGGLTRLHSGRWLRAEPAQTCSRSRVSPPLVRSDR